MSVDWCIEVCVLKHFDEFVRKLIMLFFDNVLC